MKKRDDNLDWDSFKFRVYVNETDYFTTNFYEDIDELKWKNTEKVKDIRKSKFNINENFFNAVAAMFVLTWKLGFSLENITYSGNSKILESLCKFHLYFWFKYFQKQPDLLRRHLDKSNYKFLMNQMKLYHTYTEKMDYTKQIWGYEVRDLNKKYHTNWKNLRTHTSRYGGQIAYSYEVIDWKSTLPANPEKQFVRFIRPKSNGLNSLGQTFLVESIEAFISCILGSQANSRFAIVGLGGRSLPTQEIFHKLVGSTIVQNDNTIMLSNYRTAIKDTNVILNHNISPGLLIIPSELTILKEPIPGYNNAITTSTQSMRFGTNQNLNKVYNPVRKGKSVSTTGSSGAGLLSKAQNTESKWAPNGFKKTSTPVQGTGEDETKKTADYSMFYFQWKSNPWSYCP